MKFSIDDQLKIMQAGRYSLIDFSIITNPKYKPSWHHESLGKALEMVENGQIKRLIIQMPPRHGKSQLASINFPAWYMGRNPDKEIIASSYSSDLAQDFGAKTRDLINGDSYHNIFKTRLRADEQARGKWRTLEGGTYISTGVGGPITGRGADVLIIDDATKNREEADSEVIREKIWNWYISTAYTRLEKNGSVIVIATRWHLDDLIGRLLRAEQEGGDEWVLVSFPAIATEDEEHRKKGEALWLTKYPVEALEGIKRNIGPYDWESLYQQSPVLTTGQEFKKAWITYRDEREVNSMDTRKYLTVDPALSKKDSADYTGFCDNSVDKDNFWNLKAWREKLDPNDLVEKLFFLQSQRNYEKIGIERTAYLDGLKPYIDDQMRKRNAFLPIEPLSHGQTAKEIRIRSLIPRYASRSVIHIKGECQALEEEMFTFPKGMTDDVIDAVAYQLKIAHRPFASEPLPEGSRMEDDDPYNI